MRFTSFSVWAPSGEVPSSWLHTPEMCWQMDKMCLPPPQTRWQYFLSHIHLLLLSEILLKTSHMTQTHSSAQRSTATNCSVSDKVFWCCKANFRDNSIRQSYYGYVMSHFCFGNHCVMESRGQTWQLEKTQQQQKKKTKPRQNNPLLFIVWRRGGIYAEEMTWNWRNCQSLW